MKYAGYIFDIDGTLIDSNDAHAHSWQEVLRDAGYEIAIEKIRRLIGMGGDKLLPHLSGLDAEKGVGKEIAEQRGKLFREKYLPELKPFPGTRELLKALKKSGKELAIATSSNKRDVALLLKQAGVEDLFEEKSSADDAERSKPDPDIIHATLQKMETPPEKIVMVGDTPYDIEAAHRAGLGCIAFRCGGFWTDGDFKEAVKIYDGAQDFLATISSMSRESHPR